MSYWAVSKNTFQFLKKRNWALWYREVNYWHKFNNYTLAKFYMESQPFPPYSLGSMVLTWVPCTCACPANAPFIDSAAAHTCLAQTCQWVLLALWNTALPLQVAILLRFFSSFQHIRRHVGFGVTGLPLALSSGSFNVITLRILKPLVKNPNPWYFSDKSHNAFSFTLGDQWPEEIWDSRCWACTRL